MLLLKLMLVPLLIGLLTLAGRRWGPAVAGRLAGLPVVAGPILLLIGLEQGPTFAAQAARGALAGAVGNVVFSLVYAWCALRWSWWACLMAGYLAFAAVACGLQAMDLGVGWTFALSLAVIPLAVRGFPRGLPLQVPQSPPRLELAARMLAGAALVWLVTYFADAFGPAVSGILSAPPLMASVLAGFSHAVAGAGFAVQLLRGLVAGLYALTSFCWVLSWSLPRLGLGAGFAAAFAVALGVGWGLAQLRRRAAARQASRSAR